MWELSSKKHGLCFFRAINHIQSVLQKNISNFKDQYPTFSFKGVCISRPHPFALQRALDMAPRSNPRSYSPICICRT